MQCRALAGLIAATSLAAPAPAQTVDELIARSYDARGGVDKLRAVQTIRMKGRMSMGPGLEARITIEMKRPRNARMEFTYQGLTGVQAYDGKQAWGIAPGSRQPEPLPAEMARGLDSQGDIDGPLVDYKAKGHRVELVGKEKIDGGEAWKLKLTLKSGDVQYVYLDAVSHLEIRTEARRRVRESEVELENTIGDYREVGGVLWPHSIQSGPKGRPEKQAFVFESIEVDPALEDERFKMPAARPSEAPRQD
jgi:hypothetical protein